MKRTIVKSEINSLLVNLSNHPLSTWTQEQHDAAQVYGDPFDMEFPQVPGNASETDISQLVSSYVSRIQQMGSPERVTVHIMGELTFTFALVLRLKTLGYTCVASCTERKVEIIGDKKISEFHFTRFRRY